MTRRTRWGVIAALALTVLVMILVASQLILPSMAETRVKESLEPSASGVSVSVDAFPALKLLFGEADSITIHAAQLSTGGEGGVASLLERAASADDVTATIGTMQAGPLRVRDVQFEKRGSTFTATATLTEQALKDALPPGISLGVEAAGENGLELHVKPELLGVGVSVAATVSAEQGKIAINPNLPVLDAVNLTVFEDPEVDVEQLSVLHTEAGYVISTRGSYR